MPNTMRILFQRFVHFSKAMGPCTGLCGALDDTVIEHMTTLHTYLALTSNVTNKMCMKFVLFYMTS
jgi:hypothetical protein